MYHIGHFSSCDFVWHNVWEADGFRRLLHICTIYQVRITLLLTTEVTSQYLCVICTRSRSHLRITHIYSIKFFNRVPSIIKHTPIDSEIVDTKYYPHINFTATLRTNFPRSHTRHSSYLTVQLETNFDRTVILFTKIWLPYFKNEPVNDTCNTTNHVTTRANDMTQGRLHVSSYNEDECSHYCHSEPTFVSITFTIDLSSITRPQHAFWVLEHTRNYS